MLKIERKIESELKQLEGRLYRHRTPVGGWQAKRGFYRRPETYEMMDGEAFELSPGTHIGEKDMTVFLTNRIRLDDSYRGEKVVLLLKVGGEGCISINGKHYNGLDFNRNMVLLTDSADGGEEYDAEIETYCKDLILDSDNAFKTDVVITQSELAAVSQKIWDCYFEIKTGYEFISGCKEEYTRKRVLKLIYDALLKLDYSEEWTLEESAGNVLEAYLREIEQYRDLKMPVKMVFAGHSHIDVAWHWPLKETVRKVSRTFSSMLRLMEQYDDFQFCQSMPVLYEMAKRYYPEVYEQVKARVKEGRWETLGSMYLEPDCNLISGESFVRQIMYGKKFYREELGSDSNICFLPDVFGYSSAMPQILKKAGTDYFFTTKLTWNETNEFPYSVFKWRGLDGTEVLSGMMSMCTERGLGLYNGDLSASGVRLSLDHFKNKENGDPLLYLYGHGDGGGGVTKEMLEALTRLDKVPMTPKIEIGTVQQYFDELDKEKEYPVWSGELYFEKHRGTYTTAAKNKKNNRKSEFLFRNAEIVSVFQYLKNHSYQAADLEEGWKMILLNQFHDILPGTCIAEVYKQCDRQYEEIRRIGEASIGENLDRMMHVRPEAHNEAEEGDCESESVTIFNTLSWKRSQVVSVDGKGHKSVRAWDGTYPKQVRKEDGTIEFLAENVPSMGYRVYCLTEEELSQPAMEENCQINGTDEAEIGNAWLNVQIGRLGELISVYDKRAGREVLKEGQCGNRLKLLEDIPVEWGSAWETTTKREDKPSAELTAAGWRVKDHNCLYTAIEVDTEVHHSSVRQEIIVYHHAPLIEFKTRVDWDERQKILRTEFPAAVSSLTARYDVAFGNAEHPNHATTSYDAARFEVCGHKWGDVSESGYGVSLLNDCKYGYTIQNSDMELSLLRSADFPSDSCDKGIHTFSYWLYPHTGDIREAKTAQTGYEVNVPLLIKEGRAECGEESFLSVDSDHIIVDTVKRAEDGDGIILRLFETYNGRGDARVTFGFPVKKCEETDLLERCEGEVPVTDGSVTIDIKPFEIKTYRIKTGGFPADM